MKIGSRTHYGLRTMLEIANNSNSGGIFQKDISERQSISLKYLDHIIHELKTSGLVTNVKGKKSGYLLARMPEQISVFDVHQAMEPEICLVECASENFHCDRSEICPAHPLWKGLNILIVNYLKSVSLADLMKQPNIAEELIGRYVSEVQTVKPDN